MYRTACLLVCCCAIALPGADNTLTSRAQIEDPEQAKALFDSDVPGLAWAGFAAYAQSCIEPDLKAIYGFSRRHPNKAAQMLGAACAKRLEILVPPLMAAKPTRELAAATLAAEAAMLRADLDKRVYMAEAAEARQPTVKARKPKQKGDAADPRIAMLIELIGDQNDEVRQYAMVAAAQHGFVADGLKAAMDAVELDDMEGAMLGARLLYRARTGGEVSATELAAAFDTIKRPIDEIKRVDAELADMQVLVPTPALACQAIGVIGGSEHLELLHAALEHDDIRVRVDAAIAIADIAAPESVPVLLEQLEDCDWPVLVHVCRGLGRAPAIGSIAPLIEQLEEHEGRFRLDILHALSSIAGNQYGRQSAEQWQQWWDEQREAGFAVDLDKTRAFRSTYRVQDMSLQGNVQFYGLQVPSDRFCFVLDSSNSMSGDRIEDLRANAEQTITSMPRHVAFNLVDFGGRVAWFSESGLSRDRKEAIEYINTMPLTLGTRSYDAIEEGVRHADIDTIVFLSDGSPVWSQAHKWDDIYTACNLMNRYRPVAVWAVSFQAGKSAAKAMDIWAGEHYGNSTNVE